MQENEKEMYLQYINAIFADVRSFRRLHMQQLFESRMSHTEVMTMCMIRSTDKNAVSMPLSELIIKLRQSPQAVSRTVRHLEQMGFIERITDPDDRRNTYVRLTDTGIKEMEMNRKVIDEVSLRIFSKLGLEKCRQLDENLKELRTIAEEEIREKSSSKQ